jgi:hypothetical protein
MGHRGLLRRLRWVSLPLNPSYEISEQAFTGGFDSAKFSAVDIAFMRFELEMTKLIQFYDRGPCAGR